MVWGQPGVLWPLQSVPHVSGDQPVGRCRHRGHEQHSNSNAADANIAGTGTVLLQNIYKNIQASMH